MKLFELTLEKGWVINHKMKNIILKSISYIMLLIFLIGAMGIDSNYKMCMIMIAASGSWFIPFVIANRFIK